MLENVLEKIIQKKSEKILNLKNNISLASLNEIIDIFKGEDNDFSKAVCLNASAGLIVSENQKNIIDAYSITRKHILSGNAYEHIKKLQINE